MFILPACDVLHHTRAARKGNLEASIPRNDPSLADHGDPFLGLFRDFFGTLASQTSFTILPFRDLIVPPMKIDGSYYFAAPPESVWDVLLDSEGLRTCIPGCEELGATGEREYTTTVSVGIAVFKGTYIGRVRVDDLAPPHSYTLHVKGTGRPGFVNGVGHIVLTPEGPGTRVTVQGEAQVGGPVLSVGSRLVVPTARMLMNQFFEAMRRRAEAQQQVNSDV
jgi:uncharacterized protein